MAALEAVHSSLEAAYSLLGVDEPVVDPDTCPHEHKTYMVMGRWTCDDCKQQGKD